jgi:FkbM family methyltransferase
MKNLIKLILQQILGFNNYLFVFSIFIINKLKWDKNEKDFLHFLSIIPKDGIILDIGANIGIMTVHLARRFKQSIIFAFEPIPDNIRALKRIIRFYKLENVKVCECALGDKTGTIQMVLPVIRTVKMQGLSHVVHESIKENKNGEVFSVPIYKLDDVVELNLYEKKINAIKIDVENFEYYAIKGGEEIIKKNKPFIYCELWDNENRYKTIEYLTGLNYAVKVLIKNVLMDYDKNVHLKQNFFFIPKN